MACCFLPGQGQQPIAHRERLLLEADLPEIVIQGIRGLELEFAVLALHGPVIGRQVSDAMNFGGRSTGIG
jgi:hypothetical protein